jgi:hypothetical protein
MGVHGDCMTSSLGSISVAGRGVIAVPLLLLLEGVPYQRILHLLGVQADISRCIFNRLRMPLLDARCLGARKSGLALDR